MNDERAIEAIRTILNRMDDPAWTVPQVQTFLAALRAEGYEIYRRLPCEMLAEPSIDCSLLCVIAEDSIRGES